MNKNRDAAARRLFLYKLKLNEGSIFIINKQKNQIQQFHSDEFGNLEILMIGDKPYFPATECAKILGYKNPRDAILKHCKTDGVVKHDGVSVTVNQHGTSTNQNVDKNYISEGNLYRLIVRSKLPTAERFELFVFDTVLPSIRKHGAYITDSLLDAAEKNQSYIVELLNKLRTERGKTATLLGKLETLSPKAAYCDLILQNKDVIPVTLIAKDYGFSAATFNTLLNALGIQRKVRGTWVLYQPYADKGYTKTRTYHVSETKIAIHTYWTQTGRLFLYEILKWIGIVPLT